MFPINTSRLDSLSRRQLISDVARYALGVSLLPAGMESILNAAEKSKTSSTLRAGGKAKN